MQQNKPLNLNSSHMLEPHQAETARQVRHSQWLAENKGALDEYNRRIESCGTFSDGLRRF